MFEEETIPHKGYMIVISNDDNPFNPREDDDEIITFHIAHRNYSFGDKNYKDIESINKANREAHRIGDIVLPLYMYEHGGITISLTPFSCPWDSGQLGFVQVSRKAMIENWGKKNFTPKLKKKALEVAESTVKYFDDYLTGNVHRYDICPIDEDGEYDTDDSIESCGNYIGDKQYCIDEAIGCVDMTVQYNIKKHCEQLKTWIQNKVPIHARTSLVT